MACLALAVVVLTTGCHVPDPKDGDTLPADYLAAEPASSEIGIPYGPDVEHLLDIHHPVSGKGPAPVIVWVHPGGWGRGTRTGIPELLKREIERQGWAVVAIDFRRVRWSAKGWINTHPAPAQDIDRAIRWIKANGADHALDPTRMVLFGFSSGGQVAALAGAAPGLHVDPTLPPELLAQDPAVDGVVSVSGPLDMAALVAPGAVGEDIGRLFLGCPEPVVCDPDVVQSASVLEHLSAASAPMYLTGGLEDTFIPPSANAVAVHDALVPLRAAEDDVTGMPSVWLDVVEITGHNVDHTTVNVTYLDQWFRAVAAGNFSA